MKNIEIGDDSVKSSFRRAKYSVSINYCPECGGEVLTQCPDCGGNIRTHGQDPSIPIVEDIPDFCQRCGNSFPWTATLEEEKQRDSVFLDIDDSEINGQFYPGLVYEINLCYQVKADQAVLVLNRKLLESLIIDILRSAYGTDEIELYYDKENNRTQPLSTLIENMRQKQTDLSGFATLEEDFFRAIERLKYRGDASAHSIEENPSPEDVTDKSEQATIVAKILFRLRNEVKSAHRNP